MLIVYRRGNRAVFLYGFAKSERENINDDELATLQDIAAKMTREKKKPNRLTKALFETARDMRRG